MNPSVLNSSSATPVLIGVGIDTARYGHRVCFLRADRQPAAKPFTFMESRAGHGQLRMLCKLLSISRRTLRYWVEKGLLPEPLRLGPDGRTLRWHPGDVVDCLRRTGRAETANGAQGQANGK